ncbi:MAG TPA: 2,3,4,5-tetrahydropyridine-2,6-dicarboxylate N-succinyltransferase [Thermoanaerobaculia bacterium]|nr:2,3,4,5-tetrahydropyridine-2,6-dicarboxylate N-succinyltransferase [Thermoanaerobaculia bacterium]
MADSSAGGGDLAALRDSVERLFADPPAAAGPEHRELLALFRGALDRGEARAAEPDPASPWGWRVNPWVKQGLLLGFRLGQVVDMTVGAGEGARLPFCDKDTYPLRRLEPGAGVRLVPGGSAIRDGVYLGRGVTCMPPMYVNAGAYVGDGSMIDSHALVGSCAQVCRRVHLSAAAQLGGVLEPIGALPVIVEDDVLIGGNCGVYEGTVVQQGAVLGAGTILTRSTPVYDLVRERIHSAAEDRPLVIPAGAVVVPGSRAVSRGKGPEWGLALYTPVIVKYRDAATAGRVQLEDWLR